MSNGAPEWRTEQDVARRDWEARFTSHKMDVAAALDKHHGENRLRLQAIDAQCIANGVESAAMNVKLSRLYGEDGQPGAVDRLTHEVAKLSSKIMYGSGFLAAIVLLVGWYIEHGR